jgi:hypothetical protein
MLPEQHPVETLVRTMILNDLYNIVIPPAKAEEMYAPETFGRSATEHVLIA